LTISAVLNCCARFEPPRPLKRAQACHAFLTSPVAGGHLNSPKKLPSSDTRHMGYANCKLSVAERFVEPADNARGREGLKP
jgi:hypothetical protein